MIYSEYLNLLSQIKFGKQAILRFYDESIQVTQKGDSFFLSVKVGEEIPQELTACLGIDAPGSNLILKEEGLCFVQEVKSLDKFIQFKILILNFLDLLQFWK